MRKVAVLIPLALAAQAYSRALVPAPSSSSQSFRPAVAAVAPQPAVRTARVVQAKAGGSSVPWEQADWTSTWDFDTERTGQKQVVDRYGGVRVEDLAPKQADVQAVKQKAQDIADIDPFESDEGVVPAQPVEPADLMRTACVKYFSTIEPMAHLGTYRWDLKDLPRKKHREVTAKDVLQGLQHAGVQPRDRVPLTDIPLPMTFPNLPPQIVLNVFPYDAGYIVPLYVAKERGLDLRQVDFILGGTSLNVLANREIPQSSDGEAKYLVQKCPTTDIIVMAKSKAYRANLASIGFQFERLMTGRPLDDELDFQKFESLHLIRIAGYTVLFAAETDAVDDLGMPVELMSGKPRYLSLKVMFQMLSSGSYTLVTCDRRGPYLKDIRESTFDDMIWKIHPSDLEIAEARIGEALMALKRSDISSNAPSELDFVRNEVVLTPDPDGDLLPPADVVEELLGPRATSLTEDQHFSAASLAQVGPPSILLVAMLAFLLRLRVRRRGATPAISARCEEATAPLLVG